MAERSVWLELWKGMLGCRAHQSPRVRLGDAPRNGMRLSNFCAAVRFTAWRGAGAQDVRPDRDATLLRHPRRELASLGSARHE
jgi:hypothetical protein